MKNLLQIAGLTLVLGLGVVGCTEPERPVKQPTTTPTAAPKAKPIEAPAFSGDTAYAYVERQLAFGPRVPMTPEHRACGDWLVATLKRHGAEITEQTGQMKHYSGRLMSLRNIIASYNTGATKRVIISAHWDTRPIAENDPENQTTPIPGANDGASGVAVVLEMARQLQARAPEIGVDLILWDLEDWGDPDGRFRDSYALGSQYWARNPHKPGYTAEFGINLDMVGAEGATFLQEGYSRQYAGQVVSRVWQMAHAVGHGSYFPFQAGPDVADDHYYVNSIAQIPMIDVIDLKQGGRSIFFPHWHTLSDDIQHIRPEVMVAVGETMLAVIYDTPGS